MTKFPPLPIFDEDDQQIGEAMLEEILNKGLLHRVIHVIIEDENGRVLLQKRSMNVRTDPGAWDFSVGGYVDPGENYEQSAVRELSEELGLKNVKLESLGVHRQNLKIHELNVKRFSGDFRVVVSPDTEFAIDPEETSEVRWFTVAELEKLVSDRDNIPDFFANWLKDRYFSHENH